MYIYIHNIRLEIRYIKILVQIIIHTKLFQIQTYLSNDMIS